MPREPGGPHTSYGYTLDEAMGKLWGYLQELEIVSEKPSDTVRIDIDDLRECTGTGPGVVTIPRKTWENMEILKKIGRFNIYMEENGTLNICFYDNLSYITIENVVGALEDVVARLVIDAKENYSHQFRE